VRVIYVAVRTEAHTYALKMLHSMHIYLNHNRIVPQGLIYIYISEAVEGMSVETAAMVGIARYATVFCQLCWLIVEMEFCSSGLISFAF